jgi:hypothetical protein
MLAGAVGGGVGAMMLGVPMGLNKPMLYYDLVGLGSAYLWANYGMAVGGMNPSDVMVGAVVGFAVAYGLGKYTSIPAQILSSV